MVQLRRSGGDNGCAAVSSRVCRRSRKSRNVSLISKINSLRRCSVGMAWLAMLSMHPWHRRPINRSRCNAFWGRSRGKKSSSGNGFDGFFGSSSRSRSEKLLFYWHNWLSMLFFGGLDHTPITRQKRYRMRPNEKQVHKRAGMLIDKRAARESGRSISASLWVLNARVLMGRPLGFM